MKTKALSAIVWQEGKWFVAKTLSLEVASQGKTRKEALENLQEAVDLLLENEGLHVPPALFLKDPQLSHIHA